MHERMQKQNIGGRLGSHSPRFEACDTLTKYVILRRYINTQTWRALRLQVVLLVNIFSSIYYHIQGAELPQSV
jgi:hypothetical protein